MQKGTNVQMYKRKNLQMYISTNLQMYSGRKSKKLLAETSSCPFLSEYPSPPALDEEIYNYPQDNDDDDTENNIIGNYDES